MIAFVHIEKAAGTTMNLILRQSFGLRHCDVKYRDVRDVSAVDDEITFARSCHFSLRSIAGHGLLPMGIHDSQIALYTLLREPVSRCVSHYQYQVERMGRRIAFKDWIRNKRYHDYQVTKIAGTRDLEKAKIILRERFFFVGLVERFDESIAALAALSPYPLDIRYRSKNVASREVISQSIRNDDGLRALIGQANSLDIALYEYAKTELYPHFLEMAASRERMFLPSKYRSRLCLLGNKAWRNFVYKPLYALLRAR